MNGALECAGSPRPVSAITGPQSIVSSLYVVWVEAGTAALPQVDPVISEGTCHIVLPTVHVFGGAWQ